MSICKLLNDMNEITRSEIPAITFLNIFVFDIREKINSLAIY